MFVMKHTPEFSSICMTHVVNCIIRSGVFPEILKTSQILPILKPKKDRKLLTLHGPINNMCVIEKPEEQVLKKTDKPIHSRQQVIT